MSMTMEQVVTQLEQEVFTLRAQVASESGLADAVRAINNLATAQVRKDTPSLIDVKGLGRPKSSLDVRKISNSGRRRRRRCWCGQLSSRRKSRRKRLISSSCRRMRMRTEEFKTWSSFCSRCTQHSWLTSYEANDIVANSRQNPLEAWRRLQKRYDPTKGGRNRNLLRAIISCGRCSLLELQAGIERWESYVCRHEKKMRDKLDDEIKLAGLESLVPEELEKHLILNSDRLRTFEDAS